MTSSVRQAEEETGRWGPLGMGRGPCIVTVQLQGEVTDVQYSTGRCPAVMASPGRCSVPVAPVVPSGALVQSSGEQRRDRLHLPVATRSITIQPLPSSHSPQAPLHHCPCHCQWPSPCHSGFLQALVRPWHRRGGGFNRTWPPVP